jgi:hypothetical protein
VVSTIHAPHTAHAGVEKYGAPSGTKALCTEGSRLVAQGLTARGKMIYSSHYESLSLRQEDEKLTPASDICQYSNGSCLGMSLERAYFGE